MVHEGGVAVIRRGQFELSRNWTMGNNLRFQIPVAGPDVTAIQIGYRNMDGPGLLRTIKAMDAAGHGSHVLRWTVQVALVLGMLFSAFVYNMFLLTWLRTGFQRWYVVWLAGSLGYLLVWSGAILNIFPFLAGPAAVRTFYLLLGLMVVSGAAFFFSLIEKDKLPQRLIDFGQLAGMGVALASVVAAFDTLFPAALGDLLRPRHTAHRHAYAHGWLGLFGAARQPGDLVLSGWLAAGVGRAGVAHLPQLQPAAAG